MLAVHNGGPRAAVQRRRAASRLRLAPRRGRPLVGGEELARYRGDGVIVATATGSTGDNARRRRPAGLAQAVGDDRDAAGRPGTPIRPICSRPSEPLELRVGPASAPLGVEIDGREQGAAQPAARLRIEQSGPRSHGPGRARAAGRAVA